MKDKASVFDRPGIYSLVCSCGDCYVGQSGRALSQRFQEHKRDFLRSFKDNVTNPHPTCDSAIARHCLEKGHSYEDVKPQLLHPCEKGARMNRLEELYTLNAVIEARNAGFNVLNDTEAVFFNSFIRYVLNFNH